MDIDEIRSQLSTLPPDDRCHPECPGWVVSDGMCGFSIERCDECASYRGDEISDSDVRLLPEALIALREQLDADADELDTSDDKLDTSDS